MLELWDRLSLALLDPVLGRLLGLSWAATVVVVALVTGAVIALVRKFFTDQEVLRRADTDKRRLKELIREAKARNDGPAVKRYKATRAMVATKTFSQEGKPLLMVILPVALIATWCYARLEFRPPREAEPVEVLLYTPVSTVGELVHMVPQEGLDPDPGWIAVVEPGEYAGQATGIACWRLSGESRRVPYALVFRLRDQTCEHELLIGQGTYSKTWRNYDGGKVNARIMMAPVSLCGFSGFGAVFPLWIIVYLAVVIPAALLFKKIFRIY